MSYHLSSVEGYAPVYKTLRDVITLHLLATLQKANSLVIKSMKPKHAY